MSKTKCKLKTGDAVIVTAGKDKGKQGDILKVFPSESRVLVKGINVVKKHQKATQTTASSILEKELPIHVSNVAYFDKQTAQASKIGYKFENGEKIRFLKKSNSVI